MSAESNLALPRYRLETLGTLALKGSDKATAASDQRQQRRRLALLAVLACSEKLGRTRDQLLLFFWPDSTERKARHSLDQLLYSIRSSLDDSIFAGVNPLRLNAAIISADVIDFEKRLDEEDFAAAVELWRGPFLDGFYLSEAREFEDWVEGERRRLASRYTDALEYLALEAENKHDQPGAIRWRQRLVDADPLSARYAIAMASALANAGDYPAAMAFADRYERTASRELGNGNFPDVRKAIREISDRASSIAVTGRVPAPPANPVAVEPATGDLTQPLKTDAPRKPQRRRVAITVLVTFGLLVASMAAFMISSRAGGDTAARNSPSAIRPPATPGRATHSARNGTRNLAAYEFYVRGQDPVLLRSDSGARMGLSYMSKAVELDSTFAAGYAGLSEMYGREAMSDLPIRPVPELRRLAEKAARKAIALDDSLAEAHAAMGLIESHGLINLPDAEKELKRAVELDPSDSKSREYLAMTRALMGMTSEALTDAQGAVAADPLSPTAQATVAQILYLLDRCDEALPILEKLSTMKPPPLRVAIARSLCFIREQKWTEAEDIVRADAAGGSVNSIAILGLAFAKSGRTGEAIDLRRRLKTMTDRDPTAYYGIAMISSGLGQTDDAIANLGRGRADGILAYQLVGPLFATLHADPRFNAIMGRRGIRVASQQGDTRLHRLTLGRKSSYLGGVSQPPD